MPDLTDEQWRILNEKIDLIIAHRASIEAQCAEIKGEIVKLRQVEIKDIVQKVLRNQH